MKDLRGAARMAANMLERDGTPVRAEAAQELLEAVAEQQEDAAELVEALRRLLRWDLEGKSVRSEDVAFAQRVLAKHGRSPSKEGGAA